MGRWLVAGNQSLQNNAYVFRVNASTGKLTPTEEKIEVGSPSCFLFVPGK